MKIRYFTIYSIIFSTFFLMLGLSGCGKPSAADQEQGQVELPGYPRFEGHPFALSGDLGTRSFEGQLLIWDPEIVHHVDQMQQVIQTSIDYYKAFARRLVFFADKINPLTDQLSSLMAELSSLQIQKGALLRTARLEQALPWFEAQLVALAPPLADKDRVQVSELFADYCEAKVWEYLISSKLIDVSYSERPTPLAFCEPVYTTKGLLSRDSEVCSSSKNVDGTNGGTKNYFACFWTEGVLKSKFFQRYSPDRQALLRGIDPGLFLHTVASMNSLARNRAYNSLRSQTGYVKIPQDGTRYMLGADAANASKYSPQNALESIDWSLGDPPKDSMYWDLNPAVVAQLSAARVFERMRTVSVSPKKDSDITVNDFIFNNVPIASSELKLSAEVLEAAEIALPEIFHVVNPKPEIDERLGKITSEAEELKNQIAIERTEVDRNASVGDAMLARSNAAMAKGVALTLFNQLTQLEVKSLGHSLYRVSLNIRREASDISACFNTDSRSQVECPAAPHSVRPGQENIRSSLQMDPETGKITIVAYPNTMKEIESLGLGFSERRGDNVPDFNTMHPEDALGTDVRFELFPNTWEKLVNIVSGNVFFVDRTSGQKRFSGNVMLFDTAIKEESIRR